MTVTTSLPMTGGIGYSPFPTVRRISGRILYDCCCFWLHWLPTVFDVQCTSWCCDWKDKLIGRQSERKEVWLHLTVWNVNLDYLSTFVECISVDFCLCYIYYMYIFFSSCPLKICKLSLWLKWMFIIRTVPCCIGLMHFMLQLLFAVILQYNEH